MKLLKVFTLSPSTQTTNETLVLTSGLIVLSIRVPRWSFFRSSLSFNYLPQSSTSKTEDKEGNEYHGNVFSDMGR